ncbi:hypothetical protein A5764_21675 [Mycobacterium sp. 852002-51057_SCH5723018]|nr:hypothetical protein A5764_21675 [Mycobacterium sp. 852002-51057_SCH5723018]
MRNILGALAAVVVIPAGALAVASTASAEKPQVSAADQQFLSAISKEGIGFDTPQGAIADANSVCQSLGGGGTGGQLVSDITSHTNLTRRQAAVFLVQSVKTYCPSESGQLTAK